MHIGDIIHLTRLLQINMSTLKIEKTKLAEKFPNYRYFVANEKDVVEVSMYEL